MKLTQFFLMLILLIITQFQLCIASQNFNNISISGKMTLKDFLVEIEKQTGKSALVVPLKPKRQEFKINCNEMTIEVNFINNDINKALEVVEKYIRSKYNPDYCIHKSGPNILVCIKGMCYDVSLYLSVKIKHISSTKMYDIITANGYKAANDKRLNTILYPRHIYDEVMTLIEKYDVEIISTNENLLKNIQNKNKLD